MVSIRKIGLKSRADWAKKANVSPSLLTLIIQGRRVLTSKIRRKLALAAGIIEAEVSEMLASTRKKVRS